MTHELDFDSRGNATSPAQLDRLIAAGKLSGATDVIFLAHGFRCNRPDANTLYANLLQNLAPRLAALRDRSFSIAGVYWPSQKFPESFGTPDHAVTSSREAQDQFVASVLAQCDKGQDDPTEGLPLLHQLCGSDLLEALHHSTQTAIDTLLNFMSWNAMKDLSGKVGANGLADAVQIIQGQTGGIRVHLVGHSLGGRLMTACAKSLAHRSAKKIASLSLLEAAFSHFGFSPDAGTGEPGFFRNVMESRIVRGPMIATFSKSDTVVGKAYALASRLAQDRLQSIGDSADPYGGIGHNGAQRTPESRVITLHATSEPYDLRPGIVTCLDGSAGLIANHGDVTNAHVAHAVASAIRSAA